MSDAQSETTFSDDDIAALEAVGITTDELPSYHSILEVWRTVLGNARTEIEARITPQWATRIVSSYAELRYADMPEFQRRYFGKIIELLNLVEDQIETDDECLNITSPEEDAEHNARHYKEVLLAWQQRYLQWELEWSPADEHAAVELAAIAETHKMFFGQTGLTQQLENIRFEYTEADQQVVHDALRAQAEAFEAGQEVNGEGPGCRGDRAAAWRRRVRVSHGRAGAGA